MFSPFSYVNLVARWAGQVVDDKSCNIKLSGISRPGKPTAVVVLATEWSFDIDISNQSFSSADYFGYYACRAASADPD